MKYLGFVDEHAVDFLRELKPEADKVAGQIRQAEAEAEKRLAPLRQRHAELVDATRFIVGGSEKLTAADVNCDPTAPPSLTAEGLAKLSA